MDVERYSHVMHIVSRVFGQHRRRARRRRRCCGRRSRPGTVSGAPKVRAMQIISELEGRRRGVYAGAVGYLGFGGDMDTCIAHPHDGAARRRAYLQAGGGVVADSDPEEEYQEAMNKVAALGVAIDRAETGVYGDERVRVLVHRQLRLVHLQPGRLHRDGRRRGAGGAQRRHHGRRGRRAGRRPTWSSRPGPGTPAEAGVSEALIERARRPHPGARRVPRPPGDRARCTAARSTAPGAIVHGKPDQVSHDGSPLYAGIPSPFEAGRYHSLAARRRDPAGARGDRARTPDGEVMGVRHREHAGARRAVPSRVGADPARAAP